MMVLRWVRLAILLISLTVAVPSHAQTSASDFDGDGLSDFVLINIESSGELSWVINFSSGQSARSVASLGRNGDHIILGPWFSASSTVPGVISLNETTGQVEWKAERANGQTGSFILGESSDLFVAGADFDGNGFADAAVAARSGGRLNWDIRLNPLASAASGAVRRSSTLRFGTSKKKAFFFNPSGQGDWLAYLRRKKRGVFSLKAINPLDGKRISRTLRRLPENVLLPVPVKAADGSDLLAFRQVSGNRTRVWFKNSKGRTVARTTLESNGTALAGNFSAGPGEELAVQSSTGFIIFSPALKSAGAVTTSSGIAVDEININLFSSGTPDPGPTPPADGSCQPQNPADGNEGYLWKPNSDTQFYAVTVLPSRYTGQVREVQVLSGRGEFIKNLTSKGVGNGNRTSWQDYSLTGADYKRQYGSIIVKVILDSGACVTYAISDPSRRVD